MSRNPDPKEVKAPATWRIFCALDIPDEVRQRIREHVNRLIRTNPEVRASWTNPDNIHLTIKFLGNIAVARVPTISEAAAGATNQLSSFTLQISSCGVFPSPSHAKVLWIGVNDSSGMLSELRQRLELECEKRGFPIEERAFKPHLTLARLRGGNNTRALVDAHLAADFPAQTVTVNELIVFRSELSSHGAKYTAISKHPILLGVA